MKNLGWKGWVIMIDFCVAINGINLDCLVPLFFETLFNKVDVSSFDIHVIEKNVEPNIHQYIEQKKNESSVPFTIHILNEPFTEETGSLRTQRFWSGGDTALTCMWMMKNCGANEWVIISHFDIAFNDNFVPILVSKIGPDVGIIGEHNQGLIAIQRIAYNQCFVGFQPLSGFFVVKDKYDQWKIRHGEDCRCTDKSIRIEGFDVAELLELNMGFRGWNVKPFSEFNREHIGAGSGHHNNPGTAVMQRNRILNLLDQKGISKI